MAIYWLTFRIADSRSPKGTYDERYEALTSMVIRNSSAWWSVTTSFLHSNQKAKLAILELGSRGRSIQARMCF